MLSLGYFLKKGVMCVVLFLPCYFSHAATVYYIPSNFVGSEGESISTGQLSNVTRQANYAPICTGRRGPRLPGLDLVRGFVGASVCPGTNNGENQLEASVDYVILIDDTRRLSSYLRTQLNERQLLKNYRGREVVNSQIVAFEQNGQDTGLNILIVGEADYQIAGSNETSWYVSLSDETGNTFCELPEENRRIITDFATQAHSMNNDIASTMQNALNSFETRMSFQSSYDATPQVGSALGKEAVKQIRSYIVGKIDGAVPGFSLLVGFVDVANAEIERAEAAGRSNSMAQWIISTRTFISNCLGNSRCPQQASSGVEQLSQVSIREHIESEICRLPANRKQVAIEKVSDALNNSLIGGRENIKVFEKGFYEAWINSKYIASVMKDDSAQGTIEIVWDVEERNDILEFTTNSHTCKVNVSDYGDNADDGLNDILTALPDVTKPLDFLVKKKICFIVDNIMGGRSRECALLDTDNSVLYPPGGSTNMARRAFQSTAWRRATTRFKR